MDETERATSDPLPSLATRASPTDEIDPYATVAPSPGDLLMLSPKAESDRFRVLRPLARGGLGEVFVALDGELGREVALKEMQDQHAHHPSSRARFLLEAEVTGRLEHPGIVPIYGMGRHPDGRPYYAMRLIRGETLQEAIDRYHQGNTKDADPGERTLALRRLLDRFVEVCQTIDYAHGQGVLHRDLKPANVMLGPHGEALVVDWGLAKVMNKAEAPRDLSDAGPGNAELLGDGSMTQAGSSIGTPAYMSPEQAEGDLARIGPASDIYSLGAMLYQLLVGSPPFRGKTLVEILGQVKRGDFPRPRRVDRKLSRTLEAICLKAMALKPEERYSTARALADDLERWMAGEPTSARPEMFAQRAWRWARRRPDLAFYFFILTTGDFYYLTMIVTDFLERSGVDVRTYQAIFVVISISLIAAPFFTILISQFPMALGALIGGSVGLFRGKVREKARRGASLGAKAGLVAGSITAIGAVAYLAPIFIDEVYRSSSDRATASLHEAEKKKHQGTWVIESMETDGIATPPHEIGGLTRKVVGNDVFQFRESKLDRSSFHLDPSLKPGSYDAKLQDGPLGGSTLLGIYEFEGDRLKICSARPGQQRPLKFETRPGSGLTLAVWKRVKP